MRFANAVVQRENLAAVLGKIEHAHPDAVREGLGDGGVWSREPSQATRISSFFDGVFEMQANRESCRRYARASL